MRLPSKIAILMCGVAALSACSPRFDTAPMVESRQQIGSDSRAPMAGPRAEVNEGRVQIEAITNTPVPSLEDLKKLKPVGNSSVDDETEEDKLRRPAIRDTALAYGARGGLAHTSRQINLMLQKRADRLDQVYEFSNVVIRGPDNILILPPVISEAKKTYEIEDAGKMVRVADEVFEIIEQARIAPVKPLWHSYLIRDYSAPNPPPDEILPKTPAERDIWKKHVAEGWEAGVKQANEIFKVDMNLLKRDFDGMLRYKRMLAEGKVSAPIVSKAPMGVTGDDTSMRVNDRAIRIVKDPALQLDATQWAPTVTDGPPSEYSRPNGSTVVRDYPGPADRNY